MMTKYKSLFSWFYTGVLLRMMVEFSPSKTIVPNLLLFAAAGIITALCFSLPYGGFPPGGGIWLVIISPCFAFYGCAFWTMNYFIRHRFL